MKETYDSKQPRLVVCQSGRVFSYNDEEEKIVTEQKQTGMTEDGEPIYESEEVTKYDYNVIRFRPENTDRDGLVDGLIRLRYSLSEEMSLNRHKNNGDASYDAEWEEYNRYCEECKKIVDEYLIEKEKGLIR